MKLYFSHEAQLFIYTLIIRHVNFNLPVEFDASARARQQLAALGIVPQGQQQYVAKVLNAAAWTYVAATLQAVLTLAYFALRFGGLGQGDD